ncbi:MAG: PAS domain-containing protein [Bdellovibrionales bacterium]|nr:PAS domain-containing protein [Bdellovibrionales bacterium]
MSTQTRINLEALHESEERLNLALSAAGMGIWDWDVASGRLTWSETLERLFGFEPGTFPGTYEAYRDRVPSDEFASMEKELAKAIAEKRDHTTEHRVLLPDGGIRWVQGRGRPYFDENGKLRRMVGTTFDITERKRAQETLRRTSEELERIVFERSEALSKSHAFLDSLIENLPNMVFVKDARDLRFVRFNRAGEELLGLSRDELFGKNDYDFFPKDQADFFTEKDRAVLRGHEIVDIPEELIQTKSGIRVLHTKKIPLFGSDGKPEYLLGISEDITEYKRAEEQRVRLVHEKAARIEADRAAGRFRFLAEASTCLSASLEYEKTLQQLAELSVPSFADWCTITVKDEGGGLRRMAAVHSNREKRALIDELFRDYPVDADRTNGIAEVIRTGVSLYTPIVDDSLLRRAARDERHYELMSKLGTSSAILVPIQIRDQTVGAISLVYGHSARKYQPEDLATVEELGRRAGISIENARLYEQARVAVQARSEFLSIASHELKTPITSLKLQLQLTRRRVDVDRGIAPTPEKLAKALDASLGQIDRLVELIENLLDISRIEAGKLNYAFQRCDFSDLVADVIDRFGDPFSESAPIEFTPAGDTEVDCDPFRIEQVVVNLLSNAVKYGAGKPVRVTVVRRGDRVRLEVKDRGIGIDAAVIDRIFDRFERAVSNRNISGLGLGLYISKQIVLGHRGEIWVESEPEVGSTFFVEIPAAGVKS